MRRESREKVFQTLFMMDALGVGPDVAIPLFALISDPPSDAEYYGETVRGVWERREEIDALIGEAAEHWRVGRMALVDRNILRLGAYELSPGSDIPFAVAINEAVELGKRFGAEDSGAFINGILDRISGIARKKTTAEGSA
ncbi:MAG: NusB antitermination factor [Deltaproteobacteria bacterium]|nr:NusB antitermination factor [Deltaproteobacteria bacterium]MBP2685551.1 NusB antitermination factor [Deltaproteobacteria bacterium]